MTIKESSKERIIKYINYKLINKTQFYNDLDIKRGLLDTDKLKATIPDTVIAKILVTYPDLNIVWLLTGEGEMLVKEEMTEPISPQQNDFIYKMYQEKEQQVQKLTEELRAMERKVGNLEAELKHAETLGYRTAENVSTKKPSSQSKAGARSASAHSNE